MRRPLSGNLLASLVAVPLFLAVACGGDDGSDLDVTQDTAQDTSQDAAQDTGLPDDTTIPDGVEQPAPEGRVLIAAWGWGGQYNSDAGVTIDFFDGPMRMDAFSAYVPGRYQVAARQGDCVLYTGSDAACDPACDWDKYCIAPNTCVKAPERLSAGRVTLTAGTTSIFADPSTDEYFPNQYWMESLQLGQVDLGDSVEIQAAGAVDGIGAFSMETAGVDPIEFGIDQADNSLLLVDDQDNVVTWTTDPANAQGAYVEIVVNVGWHGSPPEAVLYCRKDATAGSLTIPAAVVNLVPQIGGPSLMPHGSHIGLVRTVTTDIDGRTVEFSVTRRHGLNPSHNAPEW